MSCRRARFSCLLITAAAAALLPATAAAVASSARPLPNIVMFLTDDQDQMLGGSFPQHGGVGPMPKTKALLADQGATATNFFIHTPICCPSRAETFTGRYPYRSLPLPVVTRVVARPMQGVGNLACHLTVTLVVNSTVTLVGTSYPGAHR